MRNRALAFSIAVLTWTGAAEAADEIVEQVAAEVNGERIMLSDVVEELRPQLAALPADLSPAARRDRRRDLIRAHLREMIRRQLILQEAERDLSAGHSRAIAGRVNDSLAALARQAGSQEAFLKSLRDQGRTLEHVTAELRRSITISVYVAAKTRSGVHVTQREMLAYYRSHRAEFHWAERRTWRVLMIRRDKFAHPDDAQSRARTLKGQLAKGADFAALVKEHSHGLRPDEGGLWGPMARDEFTIPEVVSAAFSLQADEVSPVIETSDALYLVKVEAIEPAVSGAFADVHDEIRKLLVERELVRRRDELSRRLEARAHVKVYYQ